MYFETAEHYNIILTRIMLLLDMISEILAAICIKLHLEHFRTPHVLRCLDASLHLYSVPHSRHATLSFLFRDGISLSKERI